MLTAAQLAERNTLLGSSDVSAIVGLNPYAGPVDVWNRKTGVTDDAISSDAIDFGNYMEPGILRHYVDRYAVEVVGGGDTIRHPEYPWAAATPDAIVERDGNRWIVEAKTAGWRVAHRWGPAGTEEVPEEYVCQCQWQMFVLDLDRCDLHAVIDREFRTYTITRNEAMIAALLRHAREFWDRIERNDPPPADGSEAGMRLLSSIHPEPRGERIEADEEADALARELRELYRQADEIEARKKAIRAQLCERIGDARGMTTSVGSLSWGKARETTKTDWQAVAQAIGAPDEIVNQYTKKTTTPRIFRPTWKKEENQ